MVKAKAWQAGLHSWRVFQPAGSDGRMPALMISHCGMVGVYMKA